jgi:hypothetical protein
MLSKPWLYDKHLGGVSRIDDDIPISTVAFNFEPFWFQTHGLQFVE